MASIASKLPQPVKAPLRVVRKRAREIAYSGTGRYCPVCERNSRRFRRFGVIPREDAQCVYCTALERHRLLWLFLSAKTNFFDPKPKKILHVAPEPCFELRFRQRFKDNYLTADLLGSRAMVAMDITDIDYPDQTFDVILCSHVLEHVQDDKKAMSEFHRVLKSDGWAILLVPITANSTFEDPSVVDPEERTRLFGQWNHVRRYGPDYADRLRDAGFDVEISRPTDLVQYDDSIRLGLSGGAGEIYFCTRQSTTI